MMDKPPLSPSSLTKQMFGDSAEEDELLTPGHRGRGRRVVSGTSYDSGGLHFYLRFCM